jgi:hypothetical protein
MSHNSLALAPEYTHTASETGRSWVAVAVDSLIDIFCKLELCQASSVFTNIDLLWHNHGIPTGSRCRLGSILDQKLDETSDLFSSCIVKIVKL